MSESPPPSVIEPLITRLVQEAPALDAAVIDELVAALRAHELPLAHAIARVVELVGGGAIAPGVALPALAMACATLADRRMTAREHEAARFEIETLLPVPEASRPVEIAAPDVLVSAVKRR